MDGRSERVAVALVLVAAAIAAVGLALDVLGQGSIVAVLAFAVVGVVAGGACLIAWARGPRVQRRRLPLLLAGGVIPAFAAFALAPAIKHGPWDIVLTAAGLGGVALSLLALYRQRP